MRKSNLTHKLQTLLRTDIRYLVRGSFVLGLGQIFAGLSGFILTICLVRIFDKTEYGLYTYIFSLAGMVGVFTLSGMDTVVAQEVARGNDRALIRGFWSKLRWGIPATIITLSIGGYYLFKNNEILGYSLIIIGFFSPLLYASSVYASYFSGKKQFKKIAFDNALKNTLVTASIILTVFLTHNVVYAILAFFISNTVVSIIRYYLLVRNIQKQESEIESDTLSYSKHLSAMDIFSALATHIDKILVFQFLGATQLALYAIAFAPVKQIQGVSKIIRTLILPKFSTKSILEIKNSIRHKTILFFLISLLITVAYCVFAQLFFVHFFPDYSQAVQYTQVLSLSLLFMPFMLHTQALTTHHRKKELYILNISKPLIRISLFIILVPIYGIWGAIYSFLLFYAIHYSLLLYFFKKMD